MRDPQAELEADMARAAEPVSDDDTIKASFTRLIASGRELAAAEMDWAKAKASIVADILRRGILFGVLAFVILLFAIGVLIAAAIIALAPLVGWLYAALIVAAILLVLVILLGLGAKRAFSRLADPGNGA